MIGARLEGGDTLTEALMARVEFRGATGPIFFDANCCCASFPTRALPAVIEPRHSAPILRQDAPRTCSGAVRAAPVPRLEAVDSQPAACPCVQSRSAFRSQRNASDFETGSSNAARSMIAACQEQVALSAG